MSNMCLKKSYKHATVTSSNDMYMMQIIIVNWSNEYIMGGMCWSIGQTMRHNPLNTVELIKEEEEEAVPVEEEETVPVEEEEAVPVEEEEAVPVEKRRRGSWPPESGSRT